MSVHLLWQSLNDCSALYSHENYSKPITIAAIDWVSNLQPERLEAERPSRVETPSVNSQLMSINKQVT